MHQDNQITIGDFIFKYSNIVGQGSTGNVYSGQRIHDNKPVAIKVINLKQNQNDVTKSLLQGQKKALKKLQGKKNIIQLIDLIQNQQYFYIITDIYTNGTLKDYISKKGHLSEQQSLEMFKQILNGYSSISQALIIHRDLKPANIMLTEKNQPIIIDFGYCQIIQTSTVMRAFNVGSPSYMAPQAYLKTLYSEKSDLWGLGVILYEMLTGKTLDQGLNVKQYFDKLTNDFIFKKLTDFSNVTFELLNQVIKIQSHQRISAHKMKYIIDKDMIDKIQQRNHKTIGNINNINTNNTISIINNNMNINSFRSSNVFNLLSSQSNKIHQNKFNSQININKDSNLLQNNKKIKKQIQSSNNNQNNNNKICFLKTKLTESRYKSINLNANDQNGNVHQIIMGNSKLAVITNINNSNINNSNNSNSNINSNNITSKDNHLIETNLNMNILTMKSSGFLTNYQSHKLIQSTPNNQKYQLKNSHIFNSHINNNNLLQYYSLTPTLPINTKISSNVNSNSNMNNNMNNNMINNMNNNMNSIMTSNMNNNMTSNMNNNMNNNRNINNITVPLSFRAKSPGKYFDDSAYPYLNNSHTHKDLINNQNTINNNLDCHKQVINYPKPNQTFTPAHNLNVLIQKVQSYHNNHLNMNNMNNMNTMNNYQIKTLNQQQLTNQKQQKFSFKNDFSKSITPMNKYQNYEHIIKPCTPIQPSQFVNNIINKQNQHMPYKCQYYNKVSTPSIQNLKAQSKNMLTFTPCYLSNNKKYQSKFNQQYPTHQKIENMSIKQYQAAANYQNTTINKYQKINYNITNNTINSMKIRML